MIINIQEINPREREQMECHKESGECGIGLGVHVL